MLLSEKLSRYYNTLSPSLPSYLQELHDHIESHAQQNISVSADTGRLLAFLVRLTQRKRIFEAGTFYGYSALWMALGASDTLITTCDIKAEDNIDIAKTFWQKAGCQNRISFVHQDAVEFLSQQPQNTLFDMAFIDANKAAYKDLTLLLFDHYLSEDGFVIYDNFFLKGRVLSDDTSGASVHQFNTWLAEQKTLSRCIIPVGDGITLVARQSLFPQPF